MNSFLYRCVFFVVLASSQMFPAAHEDFLTILGRLSEKNFLLLQGARVSVPQDHEEIKLPLSPFFDVNDFLQKEGLSTGDKKEGRAQEDHGSDGKRKVDEILKHSEKRAKNAVEATHVATVLPKEPTSGSRRSKKKAISPDVLPGVKVSLARLRAARKALEHNPRVLEKNQTAFTELAEFVFGENDEK